MTCCCVLCVVSSSASSPLTAVSPVSPGGWSCRRLAVGRPAGGGACRSHGTLSALQPAAVWTLQGHLHPPAVALLPLFDQANILDIKHKINQRLKYNLSRLCGRTIFWVSEHAQTRFIFLLQPFITSQGEEKLFTGFFPSRPAHNRHNNVSPGNCLSALTLTRSSRQGSVESQIDISERSDSCQANCCRLQ